jgi:hypothetical protein
LAGYAYALDQGDSPCPPWPVIGQGSVTLDIFEGGQHGDTWDHMHFGTPGNVDRIPDVLDRHRAMIRPPASR